MAEQQPVVENDEMHSALATSAEQGAEYLSKLISVLQEVAMGLQQDNRQEALQLFQHCLDGLSYVAELIHACVRGLAVLQDPRGQQMVGVAENLQNQFTQIVAAMENQDYVLLSDLLEYELVELLQRLQQMLTDIATQWADKIKHDC